MGCWLTSATSSAGTISVDVPRAVNNTYPASSRPVTAPQIARKNDRLELTCASWPQERPSSTLVVMFRSDRGVGKRIDVQGELANARRADLPDPGGAHARAPIGDVHEQRLAAAIAVEGDVVDQIRHSDRRIAPQVHRMTVVATAGASIQRFASHRRGAVAIPSLLMENEFDEVADLWWRERDDLGVRLARPRAAKGRHDGKIPGLGVMRANAIVDHPLDIDDLAGAVQPVVIGQIGYSLGPIAVAGSTMAARAMSVEERPAA